MKKRNYLQLVFYFSSLKEFHHLWASKNSINFMIYFQAYIKTYVQKLKFIEFIN